MAKPVELSASQIAAFRALYQNNYRLASHAGGVAERRKAEGARPDGYTAVGVTEPRSKFVCAQETDMLY